MKDLVKLVVYVPETHADTVREVLGKAGAGTLGEYSFCSFSVKGVGRYKPSDVAHPSVGSVGTLESVDEERIEVTCEKDRSAELIVQIKEVHPYEEVVVDIYSMLSL